MYLLYSASGRKGKNYVRSFPLFFRTVPILRFYSGKIRVAHERTVNLPCRFPAFPDRPDHKGLPPSHITCHKYTRNTGRKVLIVYRSSSGRFNLESIYDDSSAPVNPAAISTRSAGIVSSLPFTGCISYRPVFSFFFCSNRIVRIARTFPSLFFRNSFTVVW